MTDYKLPELTITKELIERIQFSVSSRNAEAKLTECVTHVFAAQYLDNPKDVKWQYVSSGVACLLRNRELHKNGRKYMWSINFCLCNINYGVLVWKAKLLSSCDYTSVTDNFHVFALGEVNVVVGLLFSSREQACEMNSTYTAWNQERLHDNGKKGIQQTAGGGISGAASAQSIHFRKEMISKPCNFQHIQGTQALDECLEIEKIKADILAALFGLGTAAGRSETDVDAKKKSKKKKEPVRLRASFRGLNVPMSLGRSPQHSSVSSPISDHGSSYNGETYPSSESHPVDNQIDGAVTTDALQGDIMKNNNTHLINGEAMIMSDHLHSPQLVEATTYFVDDPHEPVPQQPILLQQQYSTELDSQPSSDVVEEPMSPLNSNLSQHSKNSQDNHHTTTDMKYDDPYNSGSDTSFNYTFSPPRLDLSLEKELAESFLFASALTAN